jgi:arginine-tRNA-protein transferase
MGYKTRYQPQEHLTPRGWEIYDHKQDEGAEKT